MQSKGSLTGERLWLLQLAVVTVVVSVGVVSGYPDGPPLDSCAHMYPTGHHADAKTIAPPYTLSVTPTTITAGATVTVNLVATGDQTYPYFEGVFVQARSIDCNDTSPIGTFSGIAANHPFLKLMDCGGQTASAVSHKTSSHQTNITFMWTVPNWHSYKGRIYFRATVVKNEKNFWTKVFSPFLVRPNDTSPAPGQYCDVQTTDSSSALTASLSFVVFVTSFALLCKL